MPYYPEDQSEENLKKIRRTHHCTDCGREVWIYIDMRDKRKYLACPTPGHEGISREYKPPTEDYQSNIRREMELENEQGQETSRALATIPKQGQLTQSQAMRLLKLTYPKATEDEIIRTAIFCKDFGLHPLAKEVYLIPFMNKKTGKEELSMVVGIPANRKMAHALKGEFSFLDDSPRAATDEEIVKQFGKDSEEAKDNIISVTKLKGEGGNLAIGFGLWPKDSKPYGMDKGNSKRNMANIHSERQAMDRLPGKPMPRVEVIDEAYTELPDTSRVIDQSTGEIINGEAKVVSEAATPKEKKKKETPPKSNYSPVTTDMPHAAAEQAFTPPDGTEPPPPAELVGFVKKKWLVDSLATLQANKPEIWGDESIISYMKISYKVEEGDVLDNVAKMDQNSSAHFVKMIETALG